MSVLAGCVLSVETSTLPVVWELQHASKEHVSLEHVQCAVVLEKYAVTAHVLEMEGVPLHLNVIQESVNPADGQDKNAVMEIFVIHLFLNAQLAIVLLVET